MPDDARDPTAARRSGTAHDAGLDTILEAMAEGEGRRAKKRMLKHLDNVKDGILCNLAGSREQP